MTKQAEKHAGNLLKLKDSQKISGFKSFFCGHKVIFHKSVRAFLIMLTVLFAAACLQSCRSSEPSFSKTGIYFDTVVTITLYGDDSRLFDGCFELCASYEKLFDRNRQDSDIARINANSRKGIYTEVDAETIALLEDALRYAVMTKGRFDITVGELTSLWDYNNQKVPDENTVRQCVSRIGYAQLLIEGNRVLLKNTDASLDVGGIAKGYIADKLKEYLQNAGVKRGMINLGGNILLLGDKPDHTAYHIGIQMPFAADGTTIAVLSASDCAIVTSGVYERYFYEGDTLYHHILDTTTGYPVDNGLLSVTILADNATEADSLSTGVFALGLKEGKALVESLNQVEAVFVDKDGQVILTSGLKETKQGIRISQ